MGTEKLKEKLIILNYAVILYIFFNSLMFNISFFPSTQTYIVYCLALSGIALLSHISFQIETNWLIKASKLLVIIFLMILNSFDPTGLVYFLFLLRVMIASLQAQNFKKLMYYTLFLTVMFLSTFYYNVILREEFIDWAIIYTAINFGVSYLLYFTKENQNKINTLNKILTSILETTSNGIQYIDAEGKIRILNPAAQAICGQNQKEFWGKYDWDIQYDGKKFDKNGNYTSLITESLETGKVHKNVERTIVDKNGNKKTYLIETFRLFNEKDGKVMGAMGVYRDITEQKEIERQLLDTHYEMAKMAVTDELTQVYNLRYFRQRLNEEAAKAYKSYLTLLMIDVDYFKLFNDLYGHPEGDKVLQCLAQLIKDNVRDTDIVARYGGEEFTVILPGMKKEKGKEVAERIRCAIKDFKFLGEEKLPEGKLTVTIGVASIPDDAQTPEELIKIADTALYKGKYDSRDKVVVMEK